MTCYHNLSFIQWCQALCGCRFAVTGTLLGAPVEGEDAAIFLGLCEFVNPEPVRTNFGQQTGKRKPDDDDNCWPLPARATPAASDRLIKWSAGPVRVTQMGCRFEHKLE